MTVINRYEAEEYITEIFNEYVSVVEKAKQYSEELSPETNILFENIESFEKLIRSSNLKKNIYERVNNEGIKQLFSYAKQLARYYDLEGFRFLENLEIAKEKETSVEIMRQIQSLLKEMRDWQNKGGEISSRQFEMFMDLSGQYNNALIAEGSLSVSDYINNGRVTTDFEETQDAVGNYQVNFHAGIDIIGGELKSPFFITVINGTETGSNGKIFRIVGTNLRMNVLHGDSGSLKKTGGFFKPGDTIMPFPKKNNFRLASTGPHFHIELTNGKCYLNPFTLKSSNKMFKRTVDGGKSWQIIEPNF